MDRGDGLAQKPRLLQQGVDAHEVRVGQGLQPAEGDGAVLPLHPHHVGDGANGRQGAVPGEQGILPALASQGQHQLQRHTHSRQMLEGIGAVAAVGVHHCQRPRQLLLALMMVGDDHIQPDGGSEVHLLVAGDAAVHGDHQRGALVPQALDGLLGQAIALLDPAGNMPQAADAAAFEIVHQQNRGSDAVHVVVAEHGDGLPLADRPLDAGDGFVHIPHQHGGHAEAPVPLQRLGRRLGSGDTPGRQDRGEEIGVSGTPQEGNVPLSRGPDVPFFESHGTFPPFQR